jgi:hypothetical protein
MMQGGTRNSEPKLLNCNANEHLITRSDLEISVMQHLRAMNQAGQLADLQADNRATHNRPVGTYMFKI